MVLIIKLQTLKRKNFQNTVTIFQNIDKPLEQNHKNIKHQDHSILKNPLTFRHNSKPNQFFDCVHHQASNI